MRSKLTLAASAVVLAITLSYSNYFFTGVRLDDVPATRDNPNIRSPLNIPRFFVDPSTSSIDPADYTYRPIVTASFDLDYFMGRGASPFVFHLNEFIFFLGGLALIAWFYFLIFEQANPHPWNRYLAILASALFGLHPAAAELLNQVTQRGELLAAFGVVGGVALYAAFPQKRRFGLYLLPPLAGILSSPSALIFGPMLLAYILLVEPPPAYAEALTPDQIKSRDETQNPAAKPHTGERVRIRRRKHPLRRYLKAQLSRFLPALVFSAIAAGIYYIQTPPQVSSESLINYWFTEPWAAWHYFAAFFAPSTLSPSSDLAVFTSYDTRAVLGLAFVLALISVALLLAVSRLWRPTVFGIWWFIIGLLPGAVLIHPEVERDIRMFLPLIGLPLAVSWTFRMLLPSGEPLRRLEAIIAAVVIVALGFATHSRNALWNDEAALWRDNIQKHPRSVHALENYALAIAARGQPAEAYENLRQAHRIDPNSAEVEAHLGEVAGMLNLSGQAQDHFRLGLRYGADRPITHFLAGAWLEKQRRYEDAIEAYSWAASLARWDMRPRFGLMRCQSAIQDWNDLRETIERAQKVAPGDPGVAPFVTLLQNHPDTVKAAEQLVKDQATAENYGTLSVNYCMAGEFTKCLEAAQKAVQIRPDYAAGYNYVAAAYKLLGHLDDAIAAANKALQLDPDNKQAHENLVEWQRLKMATGAEMIKQ